jgi:hypothetical protein
VDKPIYLYGLSDHHSTSFTCSPALAERFNFDPEKGRLIKTPEGERAVLVQDHPSKMYALGIRYNLRKNHLDWVVRLIRGLSSTQEQPIEEEVATSPVVEKVVKAKNRGVKKRQTRESERIATERIVPSIRISAGTMIPPDYLAC